MSTITIDDSVAEKLGEVLKTANRFAWAAGYDPKESEISISKRVSEEGIPVWRIFYSEAPPNPSRRGGGFIVEVVAADNSIYRIQHGQ